MTGKERRTEQRDMVIVAWLFSAVVVTVFITTINLLARFLGVSQIAP